MDCALVSSELIRALRGNRPRTALARRLGFRSNVTHAWEHGRRAPAAADFLRLAELRHTDLRERLAAFCRRPADRWIGEPSHTALVTALLGELRGRGTVSELAKVTGVTRLTLSRWLASEGQPRLPDLLRFIDGVTQRLLEFIAIFVDPAQLPSTRAAWADLQAQLKVAYDLPWSHAVLRALEVADYRAGPRHVHGLIAQKLGISLDDEQRCLAALERAGQIHWDGTRWEVARVLAVDTARDPDANRQLKAHWAQVGLERLATSARGDGFFSYNLFAISEARYQRMRELHAEYYARLRALVAEEDAPERVVLTNLQLFPLD